MVKLGIIKLCEVSNLFIMCNIPLDGPCSLDYSKMKTPENSWSDPSASELVQRHRIYSSPTMSHNLKPTVPHKKRLFSGSSLKAQPTIPGVPSMAREHVDSLHQSADTTLLYGKNNVVLSLVSKLIWKVYITKEPSACP